MEKYITPNLTLPMLSSRNCYWGRCTFCTRAHNTFHRYEPEVVVDHLLAIERRFDASSVYLMDECVPPRNAFGIAEGLRRADSNIRWAADMRLERSLTREKLQLLYDGGCRYIAFGLESSNARVNALMQKGTEAAAISRILHDGHAVGIHLCVMFFNGFPTETREEAAETLDFVFDHGDQLSTVGMSFFVLCPGTACWEGAEALGISDIQEDWEFRCSSGMNRAEGRRFEADARRRFAEDFYEGHPLHNRLLSPGVFTMPLASLSWDGESPFPLRMTARNRAREYWRKQFGPADRPQPLNPRLWKELAMDRFPFDLDHFRESGQLYRCKEDQAPTAFINLAQPLSAVRFIRYPSCKDLHDPVKLVANSAEGPEALCDLGLVRYDNQ